MIAAYAAPRGQHAAVHVHGTHLTAEVHDPDSGCLLDDVVAGIIPGGHERCPEQCTQCPNGQQLLPEGPPQAGVTFGTQGVASKECQAGAGSGSNMTCIVAQP